MRLAPCAIAATAVLAACSNAKTDAGSAESKPSALVRTQAVAVGAIPDIVTAYGAAETTVSSEGAVLAPVDSGVSKILVAVGDLVRAGQPVATLQPGPLVTLELSRATQDAATSQAALARALRLRATGLASDAEVETSRSAAATSAATARSLQARLTGVARATIAGIVQTVGVTPGGFAPAGTAIVTLGSPLGTRVRLGLDLLDARRVHAGDPVAISSMADGRHGASRVVSVDPRADPQTRQASAFASPPAGASFGAGEPLRGEITVDRRSGVLLAPKAALIYEGEKPSLFVVASGVAHRRDVTLGVETPDEVEIRTGVAAGERIALNGATALSDGMAVREEARGHENAR